MNCKTCDFHFLVGKIVYSLVNMGNMIYCKKKETAKNIITKALRTDHHDHSKGFLIMQIIYEHDEIHTYQSCMKKNYSQKKLLVRFYTMYIVHVPLVHRYH